MKQILLFISFIACTGIFAQGPADIAFKTPTHSFGKIKQGVPVTYVFTFTNHSSKPAVIEFANAECGCTTPEYDKAPIPKGKTSSIKVTYNAANPGSFKKNVNVKFTHANLPTTLTIEGEVIAGATKAKTK